MKHRSIEEDNNAAKIKNLLIWYNSIPTLLWSILNLVPISVFCYNLVSLPLLFIFISISFIPTILPRSVLDRMQIANNPAMYKRLGVHWVNQLTQNGSIVNRLIRRKFPTYKAVAKNKTSIKTLINQTYMFEKFHLLMFLFFSLVMVYALMNGYYLWAGIILLTNIVYNVYPNLLQQYIRLKLIAYSNKSPAR